MNMNIVRAKNFEISKLKLSDPIVNSYGGKNIYVNYKKKINTDKKYIFFHLLIE